MSKHTPGPWICPTQSAAKIGFPRWDVVAKDADCVVSIARVLHIQDAPLFQRDANARLIAAAPDLLEVIKAVAKGPLVGEMMEPWIRQRMREAEAVIAKVKGEIA